MNVYVYNESSLTDVEAWNIAWTLDYQAQYHFGRSGWRSDVRVGALPKGAIRAIPAGASLIHLLDTADQPGALGYHDEDGNEVPYARVFVKTSLADGITPSSVASHELLELAVDPHVNLTVLQGDSKRLWALEVGDPCQGNDYDVGAPEGRTTGVLVADFVLPNFFDPNTPATAKTTYRGALSGPFVCGPEGYFSYIDTSNFAAGWQQSFGHAYKGPIAPDRDRQRLGGSS